MKPSKMDQKSEQAVELETEVILRVPSVVHVKIHIILLIKFVFININH